jgi:hypothetical protein
LLSSAKKYFVRVLDFTLSKDIEITDNNTKKKRKSKIAQICGLIVEDEETDPAAIGYARISLWDEFSSLVSTVERNKTYSAKLTGATKLPFSNLSTSEVTKFVEVTDAANILSKANPQTILEALFPPVTIAEAELNVSKSKADIKMVKGNVVFANSRMSKGGHPYGRYMLIDDSLDLKTIKEKGGLSVMVDPSQIRFASGSDLLILGTINKNEQGIGMAGDLVFPLLPIEYKTPPNAAVPTPQQESGEPPIDLSTL